MDIFELAKAKKMFGGGGGKREGTAIPADAVVDRIYFNTNNTREETNAILSQLTYIEGVMEYPVSLIYANLDENYEGDCLYAIKMTHPTQGEIYGIAYTLYAGGTETVLFGALDSSAFENGWMKGYESYGSGEYNGAVGLQFMELQKKGQPVTDFAGLPVGAENEKIKEVLSITPFFAEQTKPATVEGTAIPVGKEVDRIYFNIENPIEETKAVLAQLDYNAQFFDMPAYIVYSNSADGTTGILAIVKMPEDVEGGFVYSLQYINDVGQPYVIFVSEIAEDEEVFYNGWGNTLVYGLDFDLMPSSVGIKNTGLTEALGVPVGAENDKLKNVLSVTPF